MKKRILVLAATLALVAVLVMPMAVSAETTTTVTGTIPTATVTVTAPGGASLGALPYPAEAWQVVASGTDGSIAVSDLRGKSFTATVTTSSVTKLTYTTNTLINILKIATGTDAVGQQIGDVGDAATAVTHGAHAYDAVDAGYFVDVTGASQQIAAGQTSTPLVLKLSVFQKLNASEDHPAGSYTLTLTYAGSVQE